MPVPALRPTEGAADVPGAVAAALVLALAGPGGEACLGVPVPPAEIATSVWVPAPGVAGGRALCARNGIIA